MNDVPAATVKKLRTLTDIAADLRSGKNFKITRLTVLKGLCSDPDAAAQFALYVSKKTQQAMNRTCRSPSKKQQRYQRLVSNAVHRMEMHLKEGTSETESLLDDVHSEIRSVQDQYENQRWGPVRIIESTKLLVVETALQCVLHPWASSDLGYRLARQYAERYDPRHGTGLIPKSAPMVEDIAEFWGKHLLGPGWKKAVGAKP